MYNWNKIAHERFNKKKKIGFGQVHIYFLPLSSPTPRLSRATIKKKEKFRPLPRHYTCAIGNDKAFSCGITNTTQLTRYRGGVGHRYRLGGRRSGVGKRTRSPPFSSAGPPCFFLYLVLVPSVRHALLCAGPFGATAVNLCSIYPNKTDIVNATRANNSTKTFRKLEILSNSMVPIAQNYMSSLAGDGLYHRYC